MLYRRRHFSPTSLSPVQKETLLFGVVMEGPCDRYLTPNPAKSAMLGRIRRQLVSNQAKGDHQSGRHGNQRASKHDIAVTAIRIGRQLSIQEVSQVNFICVFGEQKIV